MLKNPFKIPTSEFRCGWLPKFNGIFHIYRFISGNIFIKIWSLSHSFTWSCYQANRQAKKTNVGYYVKKIREEVAKKIIHFQTHLITRRSSGDEKLMRMRVQDKMSSFWRWWSDNVYEYGSVQFNAYRSDARYLTDRPTWRPPSVPGRRNWKCWASERDTLLYAEVNQPLDDYEWATPHCLLRTMQSCGIVVPYSETLWNWIMKSGASSGLRWQIRPWFPNFPSNNVIIYIFPRKKSVTV